MSNSTPPSLFCRRSGESIVRTAGHPLVAAGVSTSFGSRTKGPGVAGLAGVSGSWRVARSPRIPHGPWGRGARDAFGRSTVPRVPPGADSRSADAVLPPVNWAVASLLSARRRCWGPSSDGRQRVRRQTSPRVPPSPGPESSLRMPPRRRKRHRNRGPPSPAGQCVPPRHRGGGPAIACAPGSFGREVVFLRVGLC